MTIGELILMVINFNINNFMFFGLFEF